MNTKVLVLVIAVAATSGVARGAGGLLGENDAPVPLFSFTPESPVAGEPVRFRDLSTDADGVLVARKWSFGDDSLPAFLPTWEHAFASAGDYVVRLTVTDDDLDSSDASVFVRVAPVGGEA